MTRLQKLRYIAVALLGHIVVLDVLRRDLAPVTLPKEAIAEAVRLTETGAANGLAQSVPSALSSTSADTNGEPIWFDLTTVMLESMEGAGPSSGSSNAEGVASSAPNRESIVANHKGSNKNNNNNNSNDISQHQTQTSEQKEQAVPSGPSPGGNAGTTAPQKIATASPTRPAEKITPYSGGRGAESNLGSLQKNAPQMAHQDPINRNSVRHSDTSVRAAKQKVSKAETTKSETAGQTVASTQTTRRSGVSDVGQTGQTGQARTGSRQPVAPKIESAKAAPNKITNKVANKSDAAQTDAVNVASPKPPLQQSFDLSSCRKTLNHDQGGGKSYTFKVVRHGASAKSVSGPFGGDPQDAQAKAAAKRAVSGLRFAVNDARCSGVSLQIRVTVQ